MRTDVLIAGGGLAGLACALALRGSGLRVTLVEAGSQLGGRARSWRDDLTGDPVDVGPHVVTTHHLNFLDVLRACGTIDRVVWQRTPLLTLFDETCHDVRLAPLPAPFAMLPALFANPVSLRARLSNLAPSRAALRLTEADVLALDAHTAIDYLRGLRVKQEFIDWFWRSMAMVLLNVPLEDCSAGALMRCYAQLLGHSAYCFGFPDGALDALFLPARHRHLRAIRRRLVIVVQRAHRRSRSHAIAWPPRMVDPGYPRRRSCRAGGRTTDLVAAQTARAIRLERRRYGRPRAVPTNDALLCDLRVTPRARSRPGVPLPIVGPVLCGDGQRPKRFAIRGRAHARLSRGTMDVPVLGGGATPVTALALTRFVLRVPSPR